MALQGSAFITMWHDVDASAEEEWHAWHTHEHMPERVRIPGFLAGRRYWNHHLNRQRCFTLYEADTAEVFRSTPYLERLNHPTPWTVKVAPNFRHFLRVACELLASEGPGIGGAIATWRLTLRPDAALDATAIAAAIRAHRPVIAAHVARARPDITGYRTAESELRPAGEELGFDALVLAEAVDQKTLAAVVPTITAALRALPLVTGLTTANYDLNFRLGADDVAKEPG
jgi:hypothetical protein